MRQTVDTDEHSYTCAGVVTFEDAGHFVAEEKPRELAWEIKRL